ncbi:MAG: NUDIX hydrolase [Steroidobacteraceae bacterium]
MTDSIEGCAGAASEQVAIIEGMRRSPDVTVAAIAERNGRFLVVEERIANRLVFNQPAGHVEAYETLLQAVVREAREETAWRFIPRALLGAYRWHRARSRRITLRFAFIGEVVDHDVGQRLDRGIVRTHWLTRDELLEREPRLRSPLVLRCIDDYLGGRRLPLEPVASLDLHTAASTSAEIV